MTEFVSINGYACPFDTPTWSTPQSEIIDRHAFDAMLADMRARDIHLVWGHHEADAPVLAATSTGGLSLFADRFGLAFRATFRAANAPSGWRREMTQRRGAFDQCSVMFGNIARSRIEQSPNSVRRVLEAYIEHIAIVPRAAYGEKTGAWIAGSFNGCEPYRLREMNARWQAGWQSHQRRQREKPRPAGSMPPRIAAALAPHAARFREFRAAAAARFRATGVMPVMAHIAFTKAAGFDAGEWMQMISCGARHGWRSPGE